MTPKEILKLEKLQKYLITSCQHFAEDNQTDYDKLRDWPIVPRKYMHLINDQDIRIYKRMTEFSSCSQQ